ncbi:methylated-DNA--[protein]-cysteine S-methyltransferase [Sulfitobacter sp.]|uniref:methylated-DNA--[protein]-cysteine S-methyltransferase n=1 Tax=Sulfitobacter sp. TaxID=1903071 RepID=UPI003F6B5043
MKQCSVVTQFGTLTLTEETGAITRLSWGHVDAGATSDLLDRAADQLRAFDAGRLTQFDVPLQVAGSDVLRAVCAEISAIPFGETCTYGDIAKKLGIPAQVVGQACGQNPIPVIIPCHRVMGAKGLTGYSGAGGIETKIALLRHEGAAGLLI